MRELKKNIGELPGIHWLIGSIKEQPVLWVFLLAFGIRLYANLSTYVINPDGVHYIYQARAIFFNDWQHLTTCHLSYISPFPFLIATMYAVVHDWLIAARIVTLLFSVGGLIPLYFICTRFFDRGISALTLLVFVMIPAFVGRSADVIRDPIFLPFLTLGMFFFLRYWPPSKTSRPNLSLVLSCLFFILATWTRVEGIMYFAVSALYLLAANKGQRIKSTFFFLLPILILAGMGLTTLFAMGFSADELLRVEKIKDEISLLIGNYDSIEAYHGSIIGSTSGIISEFFRRSRELIWFIPIGALITCILEKFFYPYVLICLWGFFNRGWLLEKKPASFFLFSIVTAIVVLYIHLINTWMIFDRFLTILIVPAIIFVANGCKNIVTFLQGKLNIDRKNAIIILSLFILIFGFGKNLPPRYEEKKALADIGHTIQQDKVPGQLIRIAAAYSNIYERVFFYANLDWPGAPCARGFLIDINADYNTFVASLEKNNVQYVLFSDDGQPEWYNNSMHSNDFKVLGEWRYDNKKTLYLLSLKQ